MGKTQEITKSAIRNPSLSFGVSSPSCLSSQSKDPASLLCASNDNPESETGDADLNVQPFLSVCLCFYIIARQLVILSKQIMDISDLLVILKTQYLFSRKCALTTLHTSLPITQVRHSSPGYSQHPV